MKAVEETVGGGCCEFLNLKEKFKLAVGKSGKTKRLSGDETRIPRKTISDEKIKIGNLEINALPVDHSLPGARAYIIHSSEGAVIYTGDLRFHGWNGKKTENFIVKAAKEKPITLLCEGTRIDQTTGMSEAGVLKRIDGIIHDTKGLVAANFPQRDTDRMKTFLKVAKNNGRKLAITFKQAYMLDAMREEGCTDCPRTDDADMLLFAEKKSWGLVGRNEFQKEEIDKDYSKWEREYLHRDNAITIEEIGKQQNKNVLYCSFFDLQNLTDIKISAGSKYIRSMCEPFSEEMMLDERRINNWLKLLGLHPYEQAHASGHASGPEIKRLIETIKPKKVFPMHTEHPEMFAKLVKGIPVELPVLGREIKV